MAVALGEYRRLEVRRAERPHVVQPLGQLERMLDVLARGLVVALAAIAARPPREDAHAQLVGRQPRALREHERLVEETDRGRDARQQIPAHPQPVEHLGAVDVGKLVALDERACLGEEREALLHLAVLGAGHRLAAQRAYAELGSARREHGRQRADVLGDRRLDRMLFEQRVGARERRLGLRALVGGDAAREEPGIDAEAQREPFDRLARRPRLAALDLRDVLLREALARDIRLRETGRDPKLAQAFAETRSAGCSGQSDCSLVRRGVA